MLKSARGLRSTAVPARLASQSSVLVKRVGIPCRAWCVVRLHIHSRAVLQLSWQSVDGSEAGYSSNVMTTFKSLVFHRLGGPFPAQHYSTPANSGMVSLSAESRFLHAWP